MMERINDLEELGEEDSLLIIFKEDYAEGMMIFKVIKKDYYVKLFDGIVYVFDEEFEVRGRFGMEYVDKFVRLSKG